MIGYLSKGFPFTTGEIFQACVFQAMHDFLFGNDLSTYTLTTDQKFIAASIWIIQSSSIFLDGLDRKGKYIFITYYYIVKSKASKMQAINMVQRRSKFNTLKCQVGSICCYFV